MAIYDLILYLSIYLYIIIMPLIYSKYKFMNISFNGDIWLVIVVIIYLVGLVFFKDTRRRFTLGIKEFFTNYLSLSILALIIIMLISFIYAEDITSSISSTSRFISYIVIYFIILCEGSKRKFLKGILLSYICVSLIIGVVGIFDYINGIGIVQAGEGVQRIRIASTLENSNNLGAYFILIIFPTIMLAIKKTDKKKKIFYIISTCIFLANIVFSFSRNAWIAFIIGCIIFGVIYSLKFLSVLIPIVGISSFIPQIRDRLKEITDIGQNTSRIKIWDVAIMIIKDHTIKGVGNGNFEEAAARYMYQRPGLKTSNFVPKHPHNIFLEMQSEIGIFGSAAFIAIIISIIIKLVYFVKNVRDKFYSAFYKGFFVSFIVFLIMNLLDDFFSAPKVIVFFWIIIAVLQAYEIECDDNPVEIKNIF
ncbi:O-antigen ligase family protein [Clostridium tyrobutyricum]|uniref:O-antigen ligase family protein n=1 Tax=Clostridium tyrobutyricum TaxID=1519 RepID=UPI001C38CB29|nr:O-antigen ligase family protein [Clostridium tyrobutyricum]MBV4425403.1 O-antigen ligase family protein [Clostridium tyrobutyricum]MBV4431912.1 O-antigen ligase family protein [Clostridium tyrobutyricum]MBV4439172.1 O-antigen ligase family protein [Clostridium tyrobutyricum]